jgi:hypothetical protein
MWVALICSRTPLEPELGRSVLWRDNVQRHVAHDRVEAMSVAQAVQPRVVVIDRDLPDAMDLVGAFRQDAVTRAISIVVFARGDFNVREVELLESGANAILRLPPGPDWDDRLFRLVNVPVRRESRFRVHLQLAADSGGTGEIFPATVYNLSVNGMLIGCPNSLGIGSDLAFAFRLPETGDVITGAGNVIRQAAGNQFGVELTHVAGAGRQLIRQFVEGRH